MHTKAQLMNYEKLAFSITNTAPVEEWRAMLKQIDVLTDGRCLAWPLSGFYNCIQKMLNDLDKTHADVLMRDDQAA